MNVKFGTLMLVSHRIRLKPSRKQVGFLNRCCGTARFVYNWGLQTWKEEYEAGNKPTWIKLDKKLNLLKKQDFPWIYEVPSCIGQQALSHLGKGMSNFFKKTSNYPVFKKKFKKDSFCITNQTGKLKEKSFQITKDVTIKMYEKLRFVGKIMSYTISRQADRWYVSILVDVPEIPKLAINEKQVGVDLGIKSFLTTSYCEVIENPKFLRKALKKLKRHQRSLSKKVKGSKNRVKARKKLAKQHWKISNKRQEFLHRITTSLVRKYQVIKIEDLNVAGMLRNHKLSLAISELGFAEFKRQLEYKCNWYEENWF